MTGLADRGLCGLIAEAVDPGGDPRCNDHFIRGHPSGRRVGGAVSRGRIDGLRAPGRRAPVIGVPRYPAGVTFEESHCRARTSAVQGRAKGERRFGR